MSHGRPARHVFIYGPPAAGKLTVASSLAERIGGRVLHNHLTTDLAEHLLDRGAPGFWDLVQDLRLRLFATAASQDIDVVSTSAYLPGGRALVQAVEDVVASAGGEVCFVRLHPTVAALERRVSSPSRRSHRKLLTVEGLHEALAKGDYFAQVNDDDLCIDNTNLEPEGVVELIVTRFGLFPRQ